ncbi:unnamed protein product [marine sediment metagenome]|uniref:Uncharacterized protein n=1 Tax=marine sediment metagenome TaxID=412755 RepID=X0X5F8_9ZZZZ
MVLRSKVNRPLMKLRGSDVVFWVKEIFASWMCMKCGVLQQTGSSAIEMTVKKTQRKDPFIDPSVGQFFKTNTTTSGTISSNSNTKPKSSEAYAKQRVVCLNCAESMLQEAVDDLAVIKKHGAKAYETARKL